MIASRCRSATEEILIPVTEEWNHMYQRSQYYGYVSRPLKRESGRDDFVTYSEPYSEECGEPVWFYSWGNARWLRCPIGRPGDKLNDHGDVIHSVEVAQRDGQWAFVVTVTGPTTANIHRRHR